MISCLHDHFLDDQLLSTPHLYFLYFDHRTFGFKKFTDLIRATGKFEEESSGSLLRFRLLNNP